MSAQVHAVIPDVLLSSLKSLLGDRCTIEPNTLHQYGKDYSYHTSRDPDVVVHVQNEQEVVEVVKLCNQYSVPIIPYGSGTSLEGHTTAPTGGVCLSMKLMSKILHVADIDQHAVVQPGLSFIKLNKQIEKYKLYFPLDAGPDASVGGMVSTSASGTKAVRYGTMKENVLALRVVMADGTVVKTANRARKTSAGYDLTHLFVASEGTLGIVTEITLKLHRIPERRAAALIDFPTIENASNSVIEIMQNDIQLGMVELLDSLMVRAINKKFNMHYVEKPTLYLEFAGSELFLNEQKRIVQEISRKYGGGQFTYAATDKEREELWKARKAALFASTVLRPGSEVWTTDVCVPISQLAKCIVETIEDLEKSFLIAPLVGHVGDGNFHLFILLDPKKKEELDEAKRINSNLVERALKMDGTCTGEHGVGIGKRDYLEKELGAEAVKLMKDIKRTLDPKNIMNPGKKIVINPSEGSEKNTYGWSKVLPRDVSVDVSPSGANGVQFDVSWKPNSKL
eukprot:TRINITY_DN4680_c0_g1_i1.p1 TRINITY_DN4680_c0_g1~~TRINITY_DN4680_c0_g1_i1.p1  ORF type:complete len:510 (-),score=116.99 TRINITY_DN4680_c0_g1_i1:834-2363(-)